MEWKVKKIRMTGKLPRRFRLWTRKKLCPLIGGHLESTGEWGYHVGSGMIDLFCTRCFTKIRQVPFEDFERMGEVGEVLRVCRDFVDGLEEEHRG